MSRAEQYEEDFLFLWHQVATDYSYLRTTDWGLVRTHYLPAARACTSHHELLTLLEHVLDSLCDFHVQLGENTATSPYPVPSATDCWAEWQAGQAILTAVRPHSPAAQAGLRAGQQLLAVNEVPVYQAAQALINPAATASAPRVQQWALLRLVAGYRGTSRQLLVRDPLRGPRTIRLSAPASAAGPPAPLVTGYRLGSAPHIGYVKVHNSLGNADLIAAFDEVLDGLLATQGLLLDLRDTPSGGNTTVARALIGRFITQDLGYQKHLAPQEERTTGIRRSWIEVASPRSLAVYTAPVVVLVNHWTGSMGEGLAIGLGELAPRVQLVGTPMAGLQGAVTTYHLPHTNIPFTIPTEQLYTVSGNVARELYQPLRLASHVAAVEDYCQEEALLQAGKQVLQAAIGGEVSHNLILNT